MSDLNWRNSCHVIEKPLFWRKKTTTTKKGVCNGMPTVSSVQITQTPLKLLLTKVLSNYDRNYDLRSFGSLCRHYWVTFLIIPLVLLICLWLIKWLTTTSEMPLLFTLQNLQKLTKMHLVFFLNRKSISGFRTGQVFAVAQTRRKLQKQSDFFCNDLV